MFVSHLINNEIDDDDDDDNGKDFDSYLLLWKIYI